MECWNPQLLLVTWYGSVYVHVQLPITTFPLCSKLFSVYNRWLFGGEEVIDGGRVELDSENGELVIGSLSFNDTGDYTCVAETEAGTDNITHTVTVSGTMCAGCTVCLSVGVMCAGCTVCLSVGVMCTGCTVCLSAGVLCTG